MMPVPGGPLQQRELLQEEGSLAKIAGEISPIKWRSSSRNAPGSQKQRPKLYSPPPVKFRSPLRRRESSVSAPSRPKTVGSSTFSHKTLLSEANLYMRNGSAMGTSNLYTDAVASRVDASWSTRTRPRRTKPASPAQLPPLSPRPLPSPQFEPEPEPAPSQAPSSPVDSTRSESRVGEEMEEPIDNEPLPSLGDDTTDTLPPLVDGVFPPAPGELAGVADAEDGEKQDDNDEYDDDDDDDRPSTAISLEQVGAPTQRRHVPQGRFYGEHSIYFPEHDPVLDGPKGPVNPNDIHLEWGQMRAYELRKHCSHRGLSDQGSKAELVARLKRGFKQETVRKRLRALWRVREYIMHG